MFIEVISTFLENWENEQEEQSTKEGPESHEVAVNRFRRSLKYIDCTLTLIAFSLPKQLGVYSLRQKKRKEPYSEINEVGLKETGFNDPVDLIPTEVPLYTPDQRKKEDERLKKLGEIIKLRKKALTESSRAAFFAESYNTLNHEAKALVVKAFSNSGVALPIDLTNEETDEE